MAWIPGILVGFEIFNNVLFFPCVGNDEYLGTENGDIPDANIMASDGNQKGRLNTPHPFEKTPGEITSGNDPWIQADIGYQTCVSGVRTQGDGESGVIADWVTSFWVSTFQTNTTSTQVFIKENGVNKVSEILFSLTIISVRGICVKTYFLCFIMRIFKTFSFRLVNDFDVYFLTSFKRFLK